MNRVFRFIVLGVLGLFLVIQFIPVDRSNPPLNGVVEAPDQVMRTLQRSCWDCHSNETEWPWYSRIAPASWRVAGHVRNGRRHLNFTEWGAYDEEEMDEAFEEIADEVGEEGMPLKDYLLVHRGSRLTGADRERLIAWADSVRAELAHRESEGF